MGGQADEAGFSKESAQEACHNIVKTAFEKDQPLIVIRLEEKYLEHMTGKAFGSLECVMNGRTRQVIALIAECVVRLSSVLEADQDDVLNQIAKTLALRLEMTQ